MSEFITHYPSRLTGLYGQVGACRNVASFQLRALLSVNGAAGDWIGFVVMGRLACTPFGTTAATNPVTFAGG